MEMVNTHSPVTIMVNIEYTSVFIAIVIIVKTVKNSLN